MRRWLPILLLLTAAGQGAPPSPRDPGVVRLAADAEARWVAFDLTPGNQIRFAMTLDGRAVTAVLDTGVSYSVLARRSPAVVAGTIRPLGRANAIGGTVAVDWMPTASLTLGALTRTGGGVTIADLPAIATGSAQAVDLLVGRDVTGGQALDIDYANRRFRLLPSGRMPFRGAVAPLTISPARQVYESTVTLRGHRLAPLVVDTGDGSAVTITRAGWRQAGWPPAGPGALPVTTAISYGLAGAAISDLAIVPEITLGDLVAHQVEVRIEPADGFSQLIGTAGRIGSGFLQNYRVLLDPDAGRMVLSPGPTADVAPLRSTSGLLLGVEPDRLRVLHVMRGGPAAAAGWRADDLICAIDGTRVAPGYATSPLARWAIGAPGTNVMLADCAGGTRTLTLRQFY